MKDVSMMPVVTMSRIGVYPDGSPVVYDPEKAAEKRKEIAEKLAEQCMAEGKKPPLTISFAPELEGRGRMDRAGFKPDGTPAKPPVTISYAPDLIRSPKDDMVEIGNNSRIGINGSNQPVMLASVSPKDAMAWIAVFDALGGLVEKYGAEAIDFFIDRFGQKPEKEPDKQPTNDVTPSYEEVA